MTSCNTIDYWLNTTYACGLISTNNNIVVDTCPIYKWMIGKEFIYVINYLKYKNKLIEIVEIE